MSWLFKHLKMTYKRTSIKFLTFIQVNQLAGENADIQISRKHYTEFNNRKIGLIPGNSRLIHRSRRYVSDIHTKTQKKIKSYLHQVSTLSPQIQSSFFKNLFTLLPIKSHPLQYTLKLELTGNLILFLTIQPPFSQKSHPKEALNLYLCFLIDNPHRCIFGHIV